MTFNSKKLITAWALLVETLVLPYPLVLLQPYRSANDSTLFIDVPADLKHLHNVVSFFYDSVKATQNLGDSNPSSMPEHSRKVLRDVLTKYEMIDTLRAEVIRELESVKNWMGGNDDYLLVTANCIIDLGTEQAVYRQ